MSRTKVVITGGAGFIGSHIAEYWANNNAEVHVVDNLRTGKRENIRHLNDIHFHQVSVTDREGMFDILNHATYVFHLAAMTSVPESILNPIECVDINVKGTINILDAAVKHKIRKVVFSSSAAVYGDDPESPKEPFMTPKPKSPYGITKLDGEYYLQIYYRGHGLEGIALRYFNVYGPRQNPKSQYAAAIPIFVSRAMRNEPIIIYGDGEQTRDFVYVNDVVNANVLAAAKEGVTGVFNVGTGKRTTINEIASYIIKETNSASKIVYQPERAGDIKHSLSSIALTKEKLGYSPAFSLMDGLSKTIEYFSDRAMITHDSSLRKT